MRAMVVDDSKAMRTILKRLLGECGYAEIVEAGNGREGLDAMSAGTPDLALVDCDLPEMSGNEFVAAVRANRAWNDVTLMMITTETATDQVQVDVAAGADAYVMKPFTKAALFEKLDIIKSNRA